MNKEEILKILQAELVMSLGCTEPGAVAYTASLAREKAGGEQIKKIEVSASINIIKNVTSVSIPGTDGFGMELAAAMGAVLGSSHKKLEILANSTPENLAEAKKLIAERRVAVGIAESPSPVYIEISVITERGQARAVIAGKHTHIALLEANGEVFINDFPTEQGDDITQLEGQLTPEIIWEFIQNIKVQELDIIRQVIQVNSRLGMEGLAQPYGLEVGRTILMGIEKGFYADDLCSYAMALTAAGSDARMAGCALPAFANSGSGNQGIQSSLPIIAAVQKLNKSEEEMLKSVALSCLLTIYLKVSFGRLSALCGATVAATGSGCGIVYLLGGSLEQVKAAIHNMLGNVTGMLCDGAKTGCALKIATCTSAAIQSALMALQNISIRSSDGIIETVTDKTVQNLGKISKVSSAYTDKVILDIMMGKSS